MNTIEQLISIAIMALVTFFTRAFSFIIFPNSKKLPKIIIYLQEVLPYAIFGLLIVYCLKDVSIIEGSHGLPELIAIILVALIYIRFKNSLVAIFIGTISYMLLVQVIFK